MRLTGLIPAAMVLCMAMAGPAVAQEWTEFYSAVDLFRINLPGKPKIQETTYTSEYDNVFPARIYTAEEGPNRYSITVADYSDARRIHAERGAKMCPKGSGCSAGLWSDDVRGAMDYATWKLTQRDTKLTFIGWVSNDRVEGRLLRFTNADRSRTLVAIHMFEDRLYIVEATAPENVPEPGILQQSMQFLDTNGHIVRYQSVYSNGPGTPGGLPIPLREEQEDNADFVKRTNADFLKARQGK
jgi:hypothetical protein